MGKDLDNRVFFDHGGLTPLDENRNQIFKSDTIKPVEQEFQQEV